MGKYIRPTLVIISNPEVRNSLGIVIQKKVNTAKQKKADHVDNDVLYDEDMNVLMGYTCNILLDDSFVAKYEESISRRTYLII